ncbi:MAG: hypothetical protein ABJB02_10070 [Dokdonella sp.]
MNAPRNQPWVERALELLDQSAASLDAATLSRLNRTRQAALVQRRRNAGLGWLIGAGLAGATLALLLAFGITHHHALSPAVAPLALEQGAEVDVVVAEDNLELYENLDFYAWLDAEQQDGDG